LAFALACPEFIEGPVLPALSEAQRSRREFIEGPVLPVLSERSEAISNANF